MNTSRRNVAAASTVLLLGAALLLGTRSVALGGAAPTARPDIATIVRQFHQNYSRGELDKNGLLVADNLTGRVNGPGGFSYQGRAQFVAWLKSGKVAFPDLTITDHDVLVVGNMAAIRYTFTGTHTGPLQTPDGVLAPTGKRITSTGAEFFTFNDQGKLTHLETIEDDLSIFTQLQK